jgi:hypothetical protein
VLGLANARSWPHGESGAEARREVALATRPVTNGESMGLRGAHEIVDVRGCG